VLRVEIGIIKNITSAFGIERRAGGGVSPLTPLIVGGAELVYLSGALLLGIGFLVSAVSFARQRSSSQARTVPRASLI
jgi:hypothetical protein